MLVPVVVHYVVFVAPGELGVLPDVITIRLGVETMFDSLWSLPAILKILKDDEK